MKMLRIVAKKDGFRRCGVAHTGTQTYPLDRFTAAQRKVLEAEPNLVVDEVYVEDPKPSQDEDTGKAGVKGGPVGGGKKN